MFLHEMGGKCMGQDELMGRCQSQDVEPLGIECSIYQDVVCSLPLQNHPVPTQSGSLGFTKVPEESHA